jgi:PAS domain S-box-containing protein
LSALVLLVMAATAAAFVLARVDSSRDAWLVLGTGLALAAVTGVLAQTRGWQRLAMPEVERYFTLAPEMVVLAGFDGYWKRVNPTVEALLGYTEREALGRPFMEFVHPDDRERSGEEARRVLEGTTIRAFENRMLCKDGSHKWIEWTVTPLPEARVMYGVGRDVTDRRRSENEHAALQRIATLVAQDAPEADVFDAIAEEIGGLLDTGEVRMLRFDSDGTAVVVGGLGRLDAFPLGSRLPLDGDSVALRVLRTRRPARFDDYRPAAGQLAETARSIGVRAVVGVPVFVEGRLWGAISAGSTREGRLPPGTEARLDEFTKLMATAIANAEAHAEVQRLANEQASLRRVATLVAGGTESEQLFAAVAEEMQALFGAEISAIARFEDDGTVVTVGARGLPAGSRWATEDTKIARTVLQTGRSARFDDLPGGTVPIAREKGIKSAVGCPVIVDGHLWGVMTAVSTEGPMPPNTEARLASFTELVATAIANAESSAELAASRRRIVAASDDARRQIERDLHDGVQQQLVSLRLELGAIKADPPTGDALRVQLATVAEDVGSVFDALVEIARGIHPAILSQGGLAAALKALGRRSAVPVELDARIEALLPDDVEVSRPTTSPRRRSRTPPSMPAPRSCGWT